MDWAMFRDSESGVENYEIGLNGAEEGGGGGGIEK